MAGVLVDGFQERSFAADGITHTVFETGTGAPVIVLHELSGLSPAALRFGRRLAGEGFTVHMPLLFGTPGQDDWRASHRALCVSEEFARLKAGVSGPIVDWLRSLARDVSGRHAGAKVGAIGMCLTGAFAIPMILEDCVTAPVAAQPGVPFSTLYLLTGLGPGEWMSQLNISDTHLESAVQRCDRDGIRVMAIRFHRDRICPAPRLDRLQEKFRSHIVRHELPGGSILRPPHSTLTTGFEDSAGDPSAPAQRLFGDVVAFLNAGLKYSASGST